jgi:hypothetical protein
MTPLGIKTRKITNSNGKKKQLENKTVYTNLNKSLKLLKILGLQ